jgi:hypothetical protein
MCMSTCVKCVCEQVNECGGEGGGVGGESQVYQT